MKKAPGDPPPQIILLPAGAPGDRTALAQILAWIAWRLASERRDRVILQMPLPHDKAA